MMLQPDASGQLGARHAVPIPTPSEITTLVDSHEMYREALRQRMEDDWDLLTLKEFDPGEGYRSYTSNEPMTYFAKMTASLAAGTLKIRIPVEKARLEKRERESGKERFFIGILKANDERLLGLGEPVLLDSLAAFINLRGWYCGRAMLVKDPLTGLTYADITPWDPLHVSWGVGPRGLRWICHKTKKTPAEIADEYGSTNGEAVSGQRSAISYSNQLLDDSVGLDVYDWYDETNNIVVIGSEYVKPPTPHTILGRVPAFFGTVGPLPLIRSRTLIAKHNLIHQGESIFAANRRLYEKVNLVMSTMLQLVALSRDHPFVITSIDGTKTIADNPWLEGSQTPLAEGDKIDLLPLLEMSRDTGAFMGLISAEVQRGALPYSVYGQLAFQLSGYAVNLLKQATDSPILPRKRAVENAYLQITNLISDQFATRAYPGVQLQGRDTNRDWFDEEFTPDMIVGLPSAEITLVVATPQDEMQKLQMAKLASEGPWPLLPMRVIWDEILNYQDTDSIADAIKEQVAERMLPTAALMVLMQALEKQGRPELAMLYAGELIKLGILNPNPVSGAGMNGQAGGGGGGLSPEALPAPMQGAPTPQPTPQQGPNVPPGSSRPGAQAGG